MAELWDFSHRRPSFLALLDTNPSLAMAQFDKGFRKYFSAFQPRTLQHVDQQTREDMLSDLKLHCLSSDFRVLRKYLDVGKPFSHWFTLVTHNRFLEILRSKKHELSLNENFEEGHDPSEPPGTGSSPEEEAFWRQLLEFTRQCLSLASPKCRQLLLLAAEECTPLELAQLLHMKAEENKKVSDDLRYCRNRLSNCLEDKGISESDWL